MRRDDVPHGLYPSDLRPWPVEMLARHARRFDDVGLAQAARRCGITRADIHAIVRGKRPIGIDVALGLEQALAAFYLPLAEHHHDDQITPPGVAPCQIRDAVAERLGAIDEGCDMIELCLIMSGRWERPCGLPLAHRVIDWACAGHGQSLRALARVLDLAPEHLTGDTAEARAARRVVGPAVYEAMDSAGARYGRSVDVAVERRAAGWDEEMIEAWQDF